VRAILIDPVERVVSETVVPDTWIDIRRRLETDKLVRVATLPAGDAVYVTEEAKESPAKFRLGHSAFFGGIGVVLGRRGKFGLFCDAVTDRDDIEVLAAFDPS
jgi:hypothetical protein